MIRNRRWRDALLALCLFGVGLRLWFLLAVDPPIQGLSDAGYYHLLGKQLAAGDGYLSPYRFLADGSRIQTAEFPPLLPFILAASSLVGIDTMLGQRVVLCLLGGVTILLVGLLGRRLGGPAAGLVAAALAAVHPMLIGADASLMTEGVSALLTAALLLASLRLVDRGRRVDAVLVGVIGGAAALTRGEGLLLLIACATVVAVVLVRLGRPALRALTVVVFAAGAVMAPWLVRNAVVFDGLVLSNNLGSVLAGSYCDETFDGQFVGSWRLNEHCFSGYDVEPGLTEAEGATAIRNDALDYARDHAGELPRVAAIRVARLFGAWDLDQQATLASYEARDPAMERRGAYVTWGLMALSLPGVVRLARRSRAAAALLLVPVLTAIGTAAVTYGNQRFRVGADVAFTALAAVALVSGAELLRRRAPESAPR